MELELLSVFFRQWFLGVSELTFECVMFCSALFSFAQFLLSIFILLRLIMNGYPVSMPLFPNIGPVLVRCCQHRTSTGPVLAHSGMFTGQVYWSTVLICVFHDKTAWVSCYWTICMFNVYVFLFQIFFSFYVSVSNALICIMSVTYPFG